MLKTKPVSSDEYNGPAVKIVRKGEKKKFKMAAAQPKLHKTNFEWI